jgi:hypothetical protein
MEGVRATERTKELRAACSSRRHREWMSLGQARVRGERLHESAGGNLPGGPEGGHVPAPRWFPQSSTICNLNSTLVMLLSIGPFSRFIPRRSVAPRRCDGGCFLCAAPTLSLRGVPARHERGFVPSSGTGRERSCRRSACSSRHPQHRRVLPDDDSAPARFTCNVLDEVLHIVEGGSPACWMRAFGRRTPKRRFVVREVRLASGYGMTVPIGGR